LGEGQKPKGAGSQARSRGRLGAAESVGMREVVIVAIAVFLILIMGNCFNHSIYAAMTARRALGACLPH
jgi:hypothetical protein